MSSDANKSNHWTAFDHEDMPCIAHCPSDVTHATKKRQRLRERVSSYVLNESTPAEAWSLNRPHM